MIVAALPGAARVEQPRCTSCGSTEKRRRNGSCRRCGSPYDLNFGKRYFLEDYDGRWIIFGMHPMEGSGKSIDRGSNLGEFPHGELGWAQASQRFLELEPGFTTRRTLARWKPAIGRTVFLAVAAGLAALALFTDGWLKPVLFGVLGFYLLTFLVLALSDSLPWND